MSIGKILIAAFLSAGLLVSGANAFTGNVTGTLTAANNSWTGTINVTGNVIVPAGMTLTIAAGTKIKAITNQANPKASITASGPITAVGSAAQFIDFYEVAVVLNNSGATQHDLEFCSMYVSPNDAITITNASAKLSHILIQKFLNNGINISGATSVVALDFATIGAKDRLFGGNNAISVNIAGGADQANIDISNSILGFENKAIETGLSIKTAGGAAATSTTVKVNYTLITGTRVGMGAGELGNITGTEPDVRDIPNLDYHLWPYSSAINAGNPASPFANEPAPNGGRVDMGCYGNTADATPFQFAVSKPNGGDSLTPGAATTITWQGGKFLGAKKLDLSIDSGKTWQPIIASTDVAGAGTYAWTVPTVKSPNCLVRIATLAGEGTDMSDLVFTIGDTVSKSGNSCASLVNPKAFRCIPFAGYRDGQSPGAAEPSMAEVKAELLNIKPYTNEIRTYGSGKGTHGNFLPAMCDTLGMKIHMGIWVDNSYSDPQNQVSILEGIRLANEGHPSIRTVIVGNEFLLRVRAAHGDEAAAEAKLVGYIKQVRAGIPASLGIVVGTGESYPDWLAASDELIKAVDRVIWHVHPWWEGKSAETAGNYAYTVYLKMKARVAKVSANKPMVIGETGYPTAATTGAAIGSEVNQARYLKDLHAWARKEGLDYWFFSSADEKWKNGEGAVGAHWGMFNADRTPKYTITHLNELIQPCAYWSNEPVGIIKKEIKGHHALGNNQKSFAIYNLQGRLLVGPSANNVQIIMDFPLQLENGKKPAQGIYLQDTRNK